MIIKYKEVIKINLILSEVLENCNVEGLFRLDFSEEDWIWVNNEIFSDLVMNVIDYDSYDEEDIINKMNQFKEKDFIDIIRSKMREIGWTEVNQLLFEKLEEGFKATEDIKTYIFAEKKFYMIRMIAKMKELQWMLKAMAVDTYQHLSPEGKLKAVYDEDFEDNFMILEDLLVKGMYVKNNCTWKVVPVSQSLVFYKNSKQHRVWAEGNANFIFYELSK